MRLSLLLLPPLLVISPGDGTGRRPAATAMPEAWNPLRPWQHLSPDGRDRGKRRMATLPGGVLVSRDGKQMALSQRDRSACPMPVVPMPSDEVTFDSAASNTGFQMPITRWGCWNPVFTLPRRPARESVSIDGTAAP